MRPIPLLAAENGVGESSANRKVERQMTAKGKENVATAGARALTVNGTPRLVGETRSGQEGTHLLRAGSGTSASRHGGEM